MLIASAARAHLVQLSAFHLNELQAKYKSATWLHHKHEFESESVFESEL